MSIASKLSYSLGHKNQVANKQLAQQIADTQDECALNELIDLFQVESPRRLLMDAILAIASVGEKNASMLVPHVDFFIQRLSDKIERVGWGSMIALSYVTPFVPRAVFEELSVILEAMGRKSVVGRDYGFRILTHLYKVEELRGDLIYIILEQLRIAPSNQIGQYTERLLSVIASTTDIGKTIVVLEERREGLRDPYHLKRLDKNLKKLYHDRME